MRNIDDSDDIMPAGEQEISDMLGSLKRFEAPGDFGFKVRARIAGRRPSGASPPRVVGSYVQCNSTTCPSEFLTTD